MFRQEFASADALFVSPRSDSGEPAIDTENDIKAAIADLSERIEIAYSTLRRIPDRERRFLLSDRRGSWPPIILSYWEAYGMTAPRVRLPPPSSAAISDMEEVMSWMSWLGRIDRGAMVCVFLCCGRGLGPTQAGDIVGLHRKTVEHKRNAGLRMILRKFVKTVDTPKTPLYSTRP